VIPVKNDSAVLRRVLADLAAQTVTPHETVIVDNASDEDIRAIAEAAGARVIDEPIPGIPAAASAGYDAATGEFIARCDADSRLPPFWIAGLLSGFTSVDRVAVTGPGIFYGLPGRARWLHAPLSRIYMGLYRWTTASALGHFPVFGSNFAMRRSAWHAVRDTVHRRGIDFHDDLDLSFHLGTIGTIVYVPDLVVGISSTPLRFGGGRRLRRGFRSIVLHWPQELPPKRMARLAGARWRSRKER